MNCKHNWHFVDGLTKRIRCTKCAAMQFTYNKEEFEKYMIASPSKGYSLADTRPNNIVFYNGKGPTPENEVMRIDATGVTVNPKVSVEDAAGAGKGVDDEIAEIESLMRSDRRAYDKDPKKQERYLELLGARERNRARA